jgi:hypothetical protein
MNKIARIEKYLFEFFSSRFETLDLFYSTTHRDRSYGIYKLKNGNLLMDFIINIHGNIEEYFFYEKLIPQKFPSPETLLRKLDTFGKYLEENQYLLDENIEGENTSYIIYTTQGIKDELIEAIEYVKIIYDYEGGIIPYEELKYKLIVNNIPDFINILKSILASVSYSIVHHSEGFHHSNVHLILKLLGFDIISEELTNNGRIDAVIRFSDKIYIIEFKFDESQNKSNEALEQIKEKEYALKFLVENKKIYGIGVSFGIATKNINGYIYEELKGN